MVVAIHTFVGCDMDSVLNICTISLRQIFNAAVPLFLAISGYFLGTRLFDDYHKVLIFLQKQISKVYFPMLIWSLPYLIYSLTSRQPVLESILYFLFGGYSIYYFIIVIVQCYLLLPFLQYKTKTSLWGAIIGLISMIYVYVITYIVDIKGALVLTTGPVLLWLFFFWLGIYLSKNKRSYKITWIITGLFISFVVMMFETKFMIEKTGVGYGIKPSSFIFSALLIMLLFSRRLELCYCPNKLHNKIIAKIGELSFAIYLIHCFIVRLLSNFMPLQTWFLRCAIVLLVSVLVVYLGRIILPSKLHKFIGF